MGNADIFEKDMICPDIFAGANPISIPALLYAILHHKPLVNIHIWFGKSLGSVILMSLSFFLRMSVHHGAFPPFFLLYNVSWD